MAVEGPVTTCDSFCRRGDLAIQVVSSFQHPQATSLPSLHRRHGNEHHWPCDSKQHRRQDSEEVDLAISVRAPPPVDERQGRPDHTKDKEGAEPQETQQVVRAVILLADGHSRGVGDGGVEREESYRSHLGRFVVAAAAGIVLCRVESGRPTHRLWRYRCGIRVYCIVVLSKPVNDEAEDRLLASNTRNC